MKASYHVMASAAVSLSFEAFVHSWPATAICFLSGVLIDVDHYLEYFIIKKKFPYRYQDLVNFCHYSKTDKVYLIFHAYELLLLLWLAIYFFHLNVFVLGLAVGVTTHIIFDQFTNPIKPLFYFLSYRFANYFVKSKMLSKSYFEKNNTDVEEV